MYKTPTDCKYWLPARPENVREAMQASLRFWDTGDHQLTVPLWAAMFYAPLCSTVPPNFALWIYGKTGTHKTALTALAMSHFGNFDTPTLSWPSSTLVVKELSLGLYDRPLWIDDISLDDDVSPFNQLMYDRSRSIYNKNLLVCTGQQMPRDEITRKYILPVNAIPGIVPNMTIAQNNDKPLYPHAMRAYIEWLGTQELPHFMDARLTLTKLILGLEMGVRFALHTGVITSEVEDHLISDGMEALAHIGF